MPDSFALIIAWLPVMTTLIGVVSFVFGAWSAAAPRQSITLYQWIMARLNWRVSPIDEPREMATTRCFGLVLMGLSLAMWWIRR